MSLWERFLRWYTGRPRRVPDWIKLATLEAWWIRERNREEREAHAEQDRAERQRRQAAAEATCAAEGHVEPDDTYEITTWGQPAPVRTMRCCTRCGVNLEPVGAAKAADVGARLAFAFGGSVGGRAAAHLLGFDGGETDAMFAPAVDRIWVANE